MVAITYVEHDGTEHAVDVDEQMSLMEGATLNMVPGELLLMLFKVNIPLGLSYSE